MSRLPIKKVASAQDRELPIFAEIDKIRELISERAFSLFAERGGSAGDDLEDWLAAEREICWSASEFIEKKKEFVLKIALAGYEPEDITVTATPRELIVKAARAIKRKEPEEEGKSKVRWSEFLSEDIYRRVELPVDVDIDEITAKLKRGLLTIEAPKVATKKEKIDKKVEIVTSA